MLYGALMDATKTKRQKPTCPVCRTASLVPQHDDRVVTPNGRVGSGIRQNPNNLKIYAAVVCTRCGIRFEIPVDPRDLEPSLESA